MRWKLFFQLILLFLSGCFVIFIFFKTTIPREIIQFAKSFYEPKPTPEIPRTPDERRIDQKIHQYKVLYEKAYSEYLLSSPKTYTPLYQLKNKQKSNFEEELNVVIIANLWKESELDEQIALLKRWLLSDDPEKNKTFPRCPTLNEYEASKILGNSAK